MGVKTKPIVTKTRKLILKKKILKLLFGTEVMELVHPHIQYATERPGKMAGDVPKPPAPTPF